MSAQVTEAHLRLANQLVSSPPSPLVLATLIADSEAKAVAEWQSFVHLKGEAIDSLLLECDRLRAERAEADADSTRERALTLANSLDEAQAELATERETSRLLRVAMDARNEGYTQSRRRMSALESEVTAKVQAVRNLAEVISGQDKELEHERAKVRVLRDACESICEEWDRNYDANPIGAGQKMETLASKALENLEDKQPLTQLNQ